MSRRFFDLKENPTLHKKKKKIKEKDKGARGEREACMFWAAYWGKIEADAVFARTPGSGAWFRSREFDVAGDIVTDAFKFPFSIEVKWREKWNYQRALDGSKSPFWGWWAQAIRDAEKISKVPLLMAKKNFGPWLIAFPRYFLNERIPIEPTSSLTLEHLSGKKVNCKIAPVLYYEESFLAIPPSRFL